jgi:hypothetical protein
VGLLSFTPPMTAAGIISRTLSCISLRVVEISYPKRGVYDTSSSLASFLFDLRIIFLPFLIYIKLSVTNINAFEKRYVIVFKIYQQFISEKFVLYF